MLNYFRVEILLVAGFIVLAYILYRVVLYTRKNGGNAELWGTIFEGLSHYGQPQDNLKEPSQYIDKVKQRFGAHDDDAEYKPIQEPER